MPVNTATLKTFAPAMRRQLLEAVGRKFGAGHQVLNRLTTPPRHGLNGASLNQLLVGLRHLIPVIHLPIRQYQAPLPLRVSIKAIH
jgi:hypothetical protein